MHLLIDCLTVLNLIVGLFGLSAALKLQRYWGMTETRCEGPRQQRRLGQLSLISGNAAAGITSLRGWLAAALSAMAFASVQAAPPKFHWTVVGGEIEWPFNITGFNNVGQMVGADSRGAFISTNGERSYLPSLSTPGSFAPQGLNDRGSVMGSVFTIGSNITSYLYQNGQYVDLTSRLGPSPPTNPSFPYSLNNMDHVVGAHGRKIFYYDGNTAHYMEYNGTPVAYRGHVDINDHDVIVGTTSIKDGPDRGFIYANGNFTFAPGFEGISAINNAGQFVGIGSQGEGRAKPVLFDNGEIRNLGTFGGDYGMAKDINNHGTIVGEAELANGWLASFYYQDGKMYNLRGLLLDGGASEWILGPYGSDMRINDAGQILVNAYRSDHSWGTYRLLLTPAPENPPWILALSGLGILLLFRRHALKHALKTPPAGLTK